MPVVQSHSYQMATGPQKLGPLGTQVKATAGGIATFSDNEVADFVRIYRNAAEQRRDRMLIRCDPILCKVAQARALDLANRKYFAHTNPDGLAANYFIRQLGYQLPDFYGKNNDSNNVESIAAGMMAGKIAWEAWLRSPKHRAHLTGSELFFLEQTDFGIGRAVVPGSPHQFYWCFLSARHP